MTRSVAVVLCLTATLLPHRSAAAGNIASAKLLSAVEQREFQSIGPVSVTVGADDKLSIAIAGAPPYLTVGYRFAEDPESPLASVEGVPMPLVGSESENFIELQLTWCSVKDGVSTCEYPTLAGYPPKGCPEAKLDKNKILSLAPCVFDYIFTRDLRYRDNKTLIPAFILYPGNLLVSETLLLHVGDPAFPTFTINGIDLTQMSEKYENEFVHANQSRSPSATAYEASYALRSGWASVTKYQFARYSPAVSCRPYASKDLTDTINAKRPDSEDRDQLVMDNGVISFPPKVYDVFTLRQMLAQTASQLSTLSGFNSASITGALTNLQGVTSASSFINAQATTLPSASTVNTVNQPNQTTTTSTPATGQSTSTVNYTCPAGFLPTIGSNNTIACSTAGGSTTSPNVATVATTTTPAGNTTPTSGASTTVTQNPLTQQTVTTSPSVTPTVPAALASTTFSAPTNIGLSAADILTEQVELNSQITTLSLALQGALSDKLLIQGGKTTGPRQQTTLGFNISLNPPRRYKHAVAEVRVWVFPSRPDDEISVVNLLPAAKTYNVAKITSKQNQFGAGVVINPINVGASAGKSKNRLYLAEDTDTVALYYVADKRRKNEVTGDWPRGATPIGRSPQERYLTDIAREIEAWQVVKSFCNSDPGPNLVPNYPNLQTNPSVFGWQFRPVLGADYVQSGIRSVFAQLALPAGLGEQYAPWVFIQTLWRDYDEKRQVVGAVYAGSCSIQEDPDPIEVISPLKVHDVQVDDMGGGVLKIKAQGEFLAEGFSVLSGQSTVTPTTFDGKNIQFFGNAASLLTTDDLELEAEDGRLTPVGMKPVTGDDPDACNILSATFNATPRPDGNSWVEAIIKSGPRYDLIHDGAPKPLFLVGGQVYGLHETPYLEPSEHTCRERLHGGFACRYRFLASTDMLRAAQSFTVRDLAWMQLKYSGKINFAPTFIGLTLLATSQPAPPDNTAPMKPPAPGAPPANSDSGKSVSSTPTLPPVYTLAGTDFQNLNSPRDWNCNHAQSDCLEVFEGLSKFQLAPENFQVASRTAATITFAPAPDNPVLTATPHITGTNINATIADGTPGAMIFYTDDGKTTPTTDPSKSHYYEAGFKPQTDTIKAIAIAPNHFPSTIAVAKVESNAPHHVIQIPASSGTASELAYKSYRFVWLSDDGEPVEWDLPVPQQTPSAVIASTILNQSDSTEITFSNVQVMASSTDYPITFT